MPFSTALFSRYGGTNPDKILTDSEWGQFTAVITTLSSSTLVKNLFNSLSTSFSSIQVEAEVSDPANAFWQQSTTSVELGRLSYSGIYSYSIAGLPYLETFQRIIFHELVHAKYGDVNASWQDGFAIEERAIFLENSVYVAAFGGPERATHYISGATPSGDIGPSVSATSYLAGLSLVSDNVSGQHSAFAFRNATDKVVKDYHIYGDTIVASQSYQYDHYITITLRSSAALLQSTGVIANQRLADQLASSVGDNFQDRINAAAAAAKSVGNLVSAINDAQPQSPEAHNGYHQFPTADTISSFAFNYIGARSISAERFADSDYGVTRDYHGLALAGTDATPAAIALDGSDLTVGVILVGGSGYNSKGVTGAASWDDIRGGSGDDLIVAGDGSTAHESIVDGGSGGDILVGGSHADHLSGGIGGDLLVGGFGADTLDGGDGYDIVSYANAAIGVTISQASASNTTTLVGQQTAGIDSDATGDTIIGVEAIIGSSHDDHVVGASNAMKLYGADGKDYLETHGNSAAWGGAGDDYLVSKGSDDYLFGGAGNDFIELGDRTRAIGGDGADVFWMDNSSDQVAWLFDTDSSDLIYWNGYAITGSASAYQVDSEELGGPGPIGGPGLATYSSSDGDPLSSEGSSRLVQMGYIGDHGIWYENFTDFDYLVIHTPDGKRVIVHDFQNGDLGINITGQSMSLNTDPDTLPQSSICNDDMFGDYQNLPGASDALANPGSHHISDFWT